MRLCFQIIRRPGCGVGPEIVVSGDGHWHQGAQKVVGGFEILECTEAFSTYTEKASVERFSYQRIYLIIALLLTFLLSAYSSYQRMPHIPFIKAFFSSAHCSYQRISYISAFSNAFLLSVLSFLSENSHSQLKPDSQKKMIHLKLLLLLFNSLTSSHDIIGR